MSDRFMIPLINARDQSNYMTKPEQKKISNISSYRSLSIYC